MIVAGFGLRASATEASLRSALVFAGDARLSAIAAPADKAAHPALAALAKAMSLPLRAVADEELRAQTTQTASPRQPARYGKGSVAEAAALAACGPGARLLVARRVGPDGLVTVALAEGPKA
jgi:cobalt-precorrin 5A hydrolase